MGRTVQIDDDVLAAVERIAAERGTTAGEIVSELARRALSREKAAQDSEFVDLPVRDGFPYLPRRGGIVTPELVERLLEDEH